jgi:bifunctional non-homologous end joining protein LigD
MAELHDTLAGRKVVLDGELVSLSADGKRDFAALRGRLAGRAGRATGSRDGQLAFMAFDLLHLDGRAVRHVPYWRRGAAGRA